MLFKKFSSDVYQKLQPEYKTYQTDNGKESLLISKNYSVVKQGNFQVLVSKNEYLFILMVTESYSW
jgi:hypothetical protein